MTPRQMLETVLDEEHAQGILDHRKAIRKPLTERAAMLLAKELQKTGDPNAAADEILLRGWRGFKSEWLVPKQPQRTSVGSVFGNLAAKMESDNGVRRIQGDEGIREAFPLLSFAAEQSK